MTGLPLAPLLDRVASVAGRPIHRDPCPYCRSHSDPEAGCLRHRGIAEVLGITTRRLSRWQATGVVDVDFADLVAVRLGWHPDAVWGPNWHDDDHLDD